MRYVYASHNTYTLYEFKHKTGNLAHIHEHCAIAITDYQTTMIVICICMRILVAK